MIARDRAHVWVVECSLGWDRRWLPRAPLYATKAKANAAAKDLRCQFREATYRVCRYDRSER